MHSHVAFPGFVRHPRGRAPMNAPQAVHRPLRLLPGDDLRARIEVVVRERAIAAAFVVCGIGSLSRAAIRLAGASQPETHDGDIEIVSLTGTVSPDGAHLHAALADASGRVFGGHVALGCRVRTTAEILLVELPGWTFSRRRDDATGFPELVIERRE
jgi:uncharacterized protein